MSPGKPLHLNVQLGKEGHLHAGSPESGLAGSLPRFSRAWLACQTLLGRDLAVGVELQRASEDAGHAVFLGVQFVRVRGDVKLDVGVTVLFASFSGQCLMRFEENNEVLQATTLPPVSLGAERVEAWLSISDGGALNFFRRPRTARDLCARAGGELHLAPDPQHHDGDTGTSRGSTCTSCGVRPAGAHVSDCTCGDDRYWRRHEQGRHSRRVGAGEDPFAKVQDLTTELINRLLFRRATVSHRRRPLEQGFPAIAEES